MVPGPKYDAILVAGEGKDSYKVYDQHKAFLTLERKYVITRVVETLQKVRSIRDIYLVGPQEMLRSRLLENGVNLETPKKIHILEQKENLYQNIWTTYLKTLPEDGEDEAELAGRYADRAALVVPCDSPLMTAHEVEYFLSNADINHFDHVLGLTPEESLEPFYAQPGVPGIKMAYLHMKEKRFRINNLHLVKPFRIKNRHFIQKMYHYRYQRNLLNVFLFSLELIGKDKKSRWRYYIGLSLGLLASWLNFRPLIQFCRSLVPKRGLEEAISSVMNTRFVGMEVPFPGAALDIDNARDFETIKIRFDEWESYLHDLDQKHPLSAPGTQKMPREPAQLKASRPAHLRGLDTEPVR